MFQVTFPNRVFLLKLRRSSLMVKTEGLIFWCLCGWKGPEKVLKFAYVIWWELHVECVNVQVQRRSGWHCCVISWDARWTQTSVSNTHVVTQQPCLVSHDCLLVLCATRHQLARENGSTALLVWLMGCLQSKWVTLKGCMLHRLRDKIPKLCQCYSDTRICSPWRPREVSGVAQW